MKKNIISKLSSAAIASLMVSGAFTSISAAEINVKEDDNHAYAVYQIFTGDYSKEGEAEVLSNLKWGLNGQLEDETDAVTGDAVPADIINEIAGATGTDANKISIISKYADLKEEAFGAVDSENALKDLPSGYYLIADKGPKTEDDSSNYSLRLIKILDDKEILTIVPKRSETPSFDKDVLDNERDENNQVITDDQTTTENGASEADLNNNKDGWGESADHALYETFQFRLSAEIPEDAKMDGYESYFLQFYDEMSEGVTFESISSVTVTTKDGETFILQRGTGEKDYTLHVAGETEDLAENVDGAKFELTIKDLKKITSDIKGVKVEVIYNAHLNENAVVGNDDGNQNTGKLRYERNPYSEGEGENGETPEDTVFVFTYDFDAVKTNGETGEDRKVLKDAEFKLKNNDGKWAQFDKNNKLTGWTEQKDEGSVLTSGEDGKFSFAGVDAGTYALVETKAPTGYNLDETELELVITATHKQTDAKNADAVIVKTFKGIKLGSDELAEIVNKKGSNLPETGGMGTTLLYTAGGMLVLGAGAVLALKKKEESAE